ncbi:MAG: hypothetical protein WBQ79_16820 [Acidobacteriaceae bacterium]
MTAISASNSGPAPHDGGARNSFRLFGVPIGDFGLFASVLISVALGFMAFFGITFLSIFGLMIYNRAGGHQVTLDTAYKFIGLPAGIFVLIVSLAAMFAIWLRRKVTAR